MQSILKYVPGFVAASIAFWVTKLAAWTEIGYELGIFLAAYLITVVSLDRGMKKYGAGNA